MRKGVGQAKDDFATVTCVLEFSVKNTWLTTIGEGSVSTMWHPVYAPVQTKHMRDEDYCGRQWDFPWNLGSSSRLVEGTVYNFVFDNCPQAIYVGSFFYAAFGHGIQENDVVSHAYFGSMQILRDLETIPAFETGYVRFARSPFLRDCLSGEVVGFDASICKC
jgi:hypothetical protein